MTGRDRRGYLDREALEALAEQQAARRADAELIVDPPDPQGRDRHWHYAPGLDPRGDW